jgi:hypothetical protein
MVGSLGSPCPRELTILLTTVPDTFSASNDYHVLADGAPGFFPLLTQAIQDGVPFDGIGIQAHEPHTMRFPLRQVQTILDRYATLGKELRITEFTPASGGDPITESHVEGVWDEAAQADYAVKFYRVTVARTRSNGVIVTWYGPSKCLSDSAAALGLTTPMKNARAGRRQNPQVFFSSFRLCLKESCGCRRVPDLFSRNEATASMVPPHLECSATRLPSLSRTTARKPYGPIWCLGLSTLPPFDSTAAMASSRRP